MAQAAAQHRIFEFHLESGGRADLAMHRERAAEHGRARRQAAIEFLQLGGRAHRGGRAFLIQAAPAVFLNPRAQNQIVPVAGDVLVGPDRRADRLGAHLLRQGHADGLRLPVGMVGPDGDAMAPAQVEDDGFRLAAGMGPGDLDFRCGRQQACRDPVEHRHRLRPGDADRLEFGDMGFHRFAVAAGPAGNDQLADGAGQRLVAVLRLYRQIELRSTLSHSILGCPVRLCQVG